MKPRIALCLLLAVHAACAAAPAPNVDSTPAPAVGAAPPPADVPAPRPADVASVESIIAVETMLMSSGSLRCPLHTCA